MTSKQQVGRKELDVAVEAPKKHQRNEESQHCITVAAQPIEITLGSVFVHKQHDARAAVERRDRQQIERAEQQVQEEKCQQRGCRQVVSRSRSIVVRSEEHTSELQSPDHLVCRLLLEKKKK